MNCFPLGSSEQPENHQLKYPFLKIPVQNGFMQVLLH